ncbi:diaminopimelate epimerase [Reichenbachiella carrageenanivorans]|uniref:Diaminopimelate epimerase n=1 Tax=Reichenbachiella carrageenanivorans TaxID=2979869 RepID=A0ABY6D3N5_9BACT|nr:diaminopimelate epimerase [Reichenbachiella carrageenanivorans]UXX80762.1 diaminopimelate epimerase [Reichenbachiella carrageenanivorans]
MSIPFYKYQGTGNDFVMIDNRKGLFPHNTAIISKICNRKFGVGADGLILIENHDSLDFEMVYFNADGSQSLCGNGSRCAVSFAHFLKIIKDETKFLTIDGPYEANLKHDLVYLHMRDQQCPEKFDTHYFLNNGSPHHIEFVNQAEKQDVYQQGAAVRYSDVYQPNGTNVNFVEIKENNTIYVRTYERGVEDETLSCGTGITASALAAADKGLSSPVAIEAKGGKLEVRFEQKADHSFTNIWLIGPAEQVFSGQFDI